MVERIAALERAKSAAAAEQAVLTAELDATRRQREAAAGVPAAKRAKGLASEVALARRDSPNRGGRHLGFARALVHEMPHTLAALQAGALSEWRATLIVRESACLTIADRATLDARMCANQTALEGKGDKRIEADAKAIAYELDPQAVVERAVRAESERTVTIRPAPDTMTYVTALLPMAQGVSVYASLRREADTCGDGRGRGQVMADTLVERVTGRPAEVPVPVAVELVITDEALLGGDQSAARVPGYGPIPAAVACRLVERAATGDRSAATVRRLYRHPASGALVAMESRARLFPKGLARFIAIRDDTCRTLTATPRSGTPITPPPPPEADRPASSTASGNAKRATTPRKPPGGGRTPGVTPKAGTPPSSPLPPGAATDPPHHRRWATWSRSGPAASKYTSVITSPGTTPPDAPNDGMWR